MAFGDDGPTLKVCCGPRCGAWPGHRAVYAAVEAASALSVRPTLCQGRCGGGVTVVLPRGSAPDHVKIADAADARGALSILSSDARGL